MRTAAGDRAWRLLLAIARGPEATRPALVAEARELLGGDAPPETRTLIDLFLPLLLPPRLTIGQMGQSLDGQIATAGGHSHYVTGEADLDRLHRLRALVDAVVVGSGTVAADDPRLTVRRVEGPDPVRVILDPEGRLPQDRKVFTDRRAPTLLLHRPGVTGPPLPGIERVEVPFPALPGGGEEPGFDPGAILELLHARGHRRVLVEGGGVTVSRFLRAGQLDRVHLTVAPLLIGRGRPGLSPHPAPSLDQALRPRSRTFPLGEDVLFDLDLAGPA